MYHSYCRLQVPTHVHLASIIICIIHIIGYKYLRTCACYTTHKQRAGVCVCVSSTQHPKKLGHNLSRGLSTGFFDHLLVVILPNKVTNSIRNALHSLLRRGARLMARLPRSAGNSHTKKILSALVPLPESHYREAF